MKFAQFQSNPGTWLAIILLSAPVVVAQTSGETKDTTCSKDPACIVQTKKPTLDDKSFIQHAAQGCMAEVELGKLATQKGSTDEVKQFGQRMIDDHTQANVELKALASANGIELPQQLPPSDQALEDQLSKLDGRSFDQAYMKAMVNDHQKDVNEFSIEGGKGHDAAVAAFATKMLPTLQDHLQQAKVIERDTKKATTVSGIN